jgi:hypothetical protein
MTVWEHRDLPVLLALATSEDENVRQGFLNLSDGHPLELDMGSAEIYAAVLALHDAGYIEGEIQHQGSHGALVTHFQVTGRGQQALGQWPLFDELASPATLALLLERLAEEASSIEEAGSLRRAATYVGGLTASTLRGAATAALAHVVRVHLGLG